MIKTLGAIQPGDLPPTMDLEFPGGRSETGMTAAECLEWAIRAVGFVRQTYGIAPILYTSARVWRDELGNSPSRALVDCPLWLARYPFPKGAAVRSGAAFSAMKAPPVPPPWGDAENWAMHQYQGDASGFPGFSGAVDMNRFNPLYFGAISARVAWVQKRLYVLGDMQGRFGSCTKASVIEFQREHGLVPDGIVGPRTFAYLAWQIV
jgi:lysozyme